MTTNHHGRFPSSHFLVVIPEGNLRLPLPLLVLLRSGTILAASAPPCRKRAANVSRLYPFRYPRTMFESQQSVALQVPARTAKLIWLVAGVLLYLGTLTERSAAQTGRCSQATLDKLEEVSDGIRDWSKLRTFYHHYRTCGVDDAEVTQGISESVARMFADRWETLPFAAELFQQDPPFETFALAGLNITDSTDDLEHIDKLASTQCPANLRTLCHRIRQSIHDNN